MAIEEQRIYDIDEGVDVIENAQERFALMTRLAGHLSEIAMQGEKSKHIKHLAAYAVSHLLKNADCLDSNHVSFETKLQCLSVLRNPVFLRQLDPMPHAIELLVSSLLNSLKDQQKQSLSQTQSLLRLI